MDHSRAPILDGLAAYWARGGHIPFTPPGHKHGRGNDPRVTAVLGESLFRCDLLSSSGLDDRASSGGLITEAQELMADAAGADGAIFSTGGSSLSVKALMLATAGHGGEILVGRDAHKSTAAGLVLGDITPRWLRPTYDEELRVAHPPSVEEVRAGLDAHPGASAVLVTSPTPYGTCADLPGIVDLCHGRGIPVLVDEAWGAHLPFHPDLPAWAIDAGADAAVISIHKGGGGLEQGSVIHYQGDLIDTTLLTQCADLLSTTSTSVPILAVIDGWRRLMVEDGYELLSGSIALSGDTADRIGAVPGLAVEGPHFRAAEASSDLDPHVITIDLRDLGITGFTAADWLREHRRVDMGLSDHRRVCAQLTYADGPEQADALVHALAALTEEAAGLPGAADVAIPDGEGLLLEQVMNPRAAFYARYEQVPAGDAAGRVCAEQLTPYPPGIPVAVPGERLTAPVLEYLRTAVAAGAVLPDPADPTVDTVRVVAE